MSAANIANIAALHGTPGQTCEGFQPRSTTERRRARQAMREPKGRATMAESKTR